MCESISLQGRCGSPQAVLSGSVGIQVSCSARDNSAVRDGRLGWPHFRLLNRAGHLLRNLPAVLLADRSTVSISTGLNPYYISCGNEPVLPIELEVPTWRILPWDDMHTTSDLLAMRARQLQRRDDGLEEEVLHLQSMRLEGKERHDDKHGIRNEELAIGSIVLLHDTRREKDMSQKLPFKWLGPYRIRDAVKEKGTYLLEEVDGSRLAGTLSGDSLKKFHPRQQFHLRCSPDLDLEVVPSLEDFLAADDDDLSDVPDDLPD